MEMPIQHALFQMESVGFPVNQRLLSALSQDMSMCAKKLENKIYALHGRRFNITSSREVAKVSIDIKIIFFLNKKLILILGFGIA